MHSNGFHAREVSVLRRLNTPERIQRFIDDLDYNKEENGPTCRSPRRVLRDRLAQCLEGALFGAAALRVQGWEPLLLDLEAVRDDDHVLAIFQMRGYWGAVAKSNYSGLRYREPVYRTLRELALSYFNVYFNLRRERTLRRYSVPVNLKRFDRQSWMTTDQPVWFIVYHLFEIKHYPLITQAMAKRLHRIDDRLFQAECMGKALKKEH